jgi:hypothetical protein
MHERWADFIGLENPMILQASHENAMIIHS